MTVTGLRKGLYVFVALLLVLWAWGPAARTVDGAVLGGGTIATDSVTLSGDGDEEVEDVEDVVEEEEEEIEEAEEELEEEIEELEEEELEEIEEEAEVEVDNSGPGNAEDAADLDNSGPGNAEDRE